MIDSDCLDSPSAKAILQVCNLIAGAGGKGPASTTAVVQRMRTMVSAGKMAKDTMLQALSYMDDYEDNGSPLSVDDAVRELTPIIRSRMEKNAIDAALSQVANNRSLTSVRKQLEKAERLGMVDLTPGIKVGMDSFGALQEARNLNRLPSGVLELDSVIDGGLMRQGLGCVVAPTGGGKSMFLTQIAGESCYNGLNVAFASLELPEWMQVARVKANLTGVPINALQEGSTEVAQHRLASIETRMGACFIKEFPSGVTSPADLEEWVAHCEETIGGKINVLVVDYADRLGDPTAPSEYNLGKVIFDSLSSLAKQRDMWVWTASQPRRIKDKKAIIDTEDIADSMHKARIADLVISANPQEDGQIKYYIAKNRVGRARVSVGPIPHDWTCARSAILSRWEPWNKVDTNSLDAHDPNMIVLDWDAEAARIQGDE